MALLILNIFFISFLLNLAWEVLHSQLYITCLELPIKKYIRLIIGAALKDGFWISIFFAASVFLFKNQEILHHPAQLFFFLFISLLFSFLDEKISLKRRRWEYSRKMPIIFGVGLSPLLELAVTGVATFLYLSLS